MNKVMTRSQSRPAARPPARRDSRRPAGAPPRVPTGGGALRTRSGDGRPNPSAAPAPVTGPRDNRPAPAPVPAAAPVVPAQTPRRPVPQPRPTDLFADLLLAVLSGQRPVHAMLRHTVGGAYDRLAELAEHSPLRTRGPRPVVRDIGYYEASPGAVEAFARIGAGDQLRALAFRLERGQDLRWRCTAVELGVPGAVRAAGG
ncbi:Rv3235 family protein [Streptomyces sp. NPDC090106]|uniref:Rv3235 family protein n=1 Tax=Streptomyces sp. NPDC090106 TaxID=3365946 RepID=UPI0037F19314